MDNTARGAVEATGLLHRTASIRKFIKLYLWNAHVGFLALVALISYVAMRDIWAAPMMRTGDLQPFATEPARYWDFFVSAWSQDNLGTTVASELSPIPRMVVLTIVGDPVVAQKVFYSTIVPAGAISMYVLAGLVTRRPWARFAAAIVFALNPIHMASPGGPLSLVVAGAPLVAWAHARLIWGQVSALNVVVYAAAFAIWSTLSLNVLPLAFLMAGALMIGALPSVPWRRILGLAIVTVAVFAFVAIVLNLPGAASFAPDAEHVATVDTSGLLLDTRATHTTATPDRLLRLAGNSGAGMSVLGYNNEPNFGWWTTLGWTLTALAGVAFWTRWGTRQAPIIGAFAVLAVAVTLFLWLTSLGVLLPVFERFNILFTFRNPGKLMILLAVGLSVLVGAGADVLGDVLKGARRIARWGVPALLALGYGGYVWPVVLGDLGTSTLMDVFNATYTVPQRYEAPVTWLQARERDGGFFRVLWVPSHPDTRLSLQWSVRAQLSAQPGAEVYGESNTALVRWVLDGLRDGATGQADRLAVTSTRYVVVDRASITAPELQVSDVWLQGPGPEIYARIQGLPSMTPVYDDGVIAIFENDRWIPHAVWVPDGIDALDFQPWERGADERLAELIARAVPVQIDEDRPTDLRIRVPEDMAGTLVLLDSFSGSWTATGVDVTPVEHRRVLAWANGFAVGPEHGGEVRLVHTQQAARDTALAISAAGWAVLGLAAVGVASWAGVRRVREFVRLR